MSSRASGYKLGDSECIRYHSSYRNLAALRAVYMQRIVSQQHSSFVACLQDKTRFAFGTM